MEAHQHVLWSSCSCAMALCCDNSVALSRVYAHACETTFWCIASQCLLFSLTSVVKGGIPMEFDTDDDESGEKLATDTALT